MRLVATEYLTLDGVFEEPGHWSFPYFNEQAMRFKADELEATEALLIGRKTYEGFAAAWPTMEGTGEFGVRMNTMAKYVVSSTLKEVTWSGSELVRGDLAAEIRQLKERPGRDLLLSGSGQLFNALMRENLIDLYRFMVHPVVLGKGARLLPEGGPERVLELVQTQSFDTGILILEYRPSQQTTP
ncbi:MAG TPA: dihydrofolate reductase family protein [Candidatus Dormibacteraeota bacterium]